MINNPTGAGPRNAAGKIIAYAAAADIILVLIFAATGRASHAEDQPLLGVLTTAWPFLSALALGWVVSRSWRAPLLVWPNGVSIVAITVAGGMALRIASGRTAELPFIIVATIVLAIFLLGHRLVAGLVVRRRGRKKRSGSLMH